MAKKFVWFVYNNPLYKGGHIIYSVKKMKILVLTKKN